LGTLASNWQSTGNNAVWTRGDFDYYGAVDVGDLGLLATNWQQGVGSPLGSTSLQEALASVGLGAVSVPESASMSIPIAGLMLLAQRLQRVHRHAFS